MENKEYAVFMEYPYGEWWETGLDTHDYEGDENKAISTKFNLKPRHDIALLEQQELLAKLYERKIPFVLLKFPKEMKEKNLWDGLFITDHGVSIGEKFYPSKFKENKRQDEVKIMLDIYKNLGMEIIDWGTNESNVEGGEINVAHNKKFFITGISRNNVQGINELSEKTNLKPYIVKTDVFHCDTICNLVEYIDSEKGVFIYRSGKIKNIKEVLSKLKEENYESFELTKCPEPYIELKKNLSKKGEIIDFESIIANVFQIGKYVFGPYELPSSGMKEFLKKKGIEYVGTPSTQFIIFSSGSWRCAHQIFRLNEKKVNEELKKGIIKLYHAGDGKINCNQEMNEYKEKIKKLVKR